MRKDRPSIFWQAQQKVQGVPMWARVVLLIIAALAAAVVQILQALQ